MRYRHKERLRGYSIHRSSFSTVQDIFCVVGHPNAMLWVPYCVCQFFWFCSVYFYKLRCQDCKPKTCAWKGFAVYIERTIGKSRCGFQSLQSTESPEKHQARLGESAMPPKFHHSPKWRKLARAPKQPTCDVYSFQQRPRQISEGPPYLNQIKQS